MGGAQAALLVPVWPGALLIRSGGWSGGCRWRCQMLSPAPSLLCDLCPL